MELAVKLISSALIVLGVLVFMWRLPKAGASVLAASPLLALLAPWAGLLSVAGSILIWFVSYPDPWLVALFLVVDPAAIALGVLVLWIQRGQPFEEAVSLQRMQANVAIALGLVAVALGYAFVMTHKTPFTPVG